MRRMRFALFAIATPLLIAVAEPAAACAPPPPGWVPPTPAQQRASLVFHASDIVYGRVESQPSGPAALRIYHVYKGDRAVGERVAMTAGFDFPIPYCAGMMTPPPPKPLGTYGVFAIRAGHADPIFVKPDDVQALIADGLIRSARTGS